MLLELLTLVLTVTLVTPDDQLPKVPSEPDSSGQLPDRSDSAIQNSIFKEVIPIAYFCHEARCSLHLETYSSNFVGALTFGGHSRRFASLQGQGKRLLFILLLNASSSAAQGTYFERERYWQRVTDSIELGTFASTTVTLSSGWMIRTNDSNWPITSRRLRDDLLSFYDQPIANEIDDESEQNFHFPPHPADRSVGVYRLVERFSIHPHDILLNFLQRTAAYMKCPTKIWSTIKSRPCGSLRVLPPIEIFTSHLQSQTIYHCRNGTTAMLKRHQESKDMSEDYAVILSYLTVVGIVMTIILLYCIILIVGNYLRIISGPDDAFSDRSTSKSRNSSISQ